MAIEKVKEYFKNYGKEKDIIEFNESSATVNLAAERLGVKPERICKSITFKGENDTCILVQTAGDTKIDNKKFKDEFNIKAKMLTPDEVLNFTGHMVGGVCAFGIENPNVKIYMDESLKRFDYVYPACGSANSAIKLTVDELNMYSKAIKFVDVCKIVEE